MEVHIIGFTVINWNRYVSQASNMILRSPTRSLDNFNMPVGNSESFLASLGEFQRKDSDPVKFLLKSNNAFRHENITFLCRVEPIAYQEIIFLANHGLVFTVNNENLHREYRFVVTGSIYSWREVIVLYMKDDSSCFLREFLYQIYLILIDQFKIIFSEYRQTKMLDGTYILEKKK